MKTYTLNTRKEIRVAVEREFMLPEMRDYAETLMDFFWEKANDWRKVYDRRNRNINSAVIEHITAVVVGKYGDESGRPCCELEQAVRDFLAAMEWREAIDDRVAAVVTEIEAAPIAVECDDDAGEDEMRVAWAQAMRARETGWPNPEMRHYDDFLGVRDLMALYDRTAGIDHYTEEIYHDLFGRYDCGL